MGSKLCRFLASLLFLAFFSCLSWAAGVTLQWTPSVETDVSSYRVYRSETTGSGYLRIDGGGLATAGYIDSTVSPGHTYYYVVTAVNSSGLESGFSSQVQAVVPALVVNQPPTANAGPDQTVTEGVPVTVTGTGSDPDGDTLSFSWKQSFGPTVTIVNAGTASMSFTAPPVTADTSLRFLLTVSDGRGGTASNEVGVRVLASVNRAPIADAGIDQTVSRGQTVYLNGSGSDPDGNTLRFGWTQRSGPVVTLSNAGTATASFIAPKVSVTTTLIFRLTVTDSAGLQGTDDVRVFVKKNATTTLRTTSSLVSVGPLFQDTFVGISLLNLDVLAAQVDISAVDSAGTDNTVRTSTLAAKSQEAFMTDSLGFLPDGISLLADSEGLVNGFSILADSLLQRMDEIGTQAVPSSVVYFPGTGLHPAEKTLLAVSNSDPAYPADLTLRLISQSGSVLAEAQSSLAPLATKQDTLSHFLSGVAIPTAPYYLRVSATKPIQAFGLQADSLYFATLPAQSATAVSRMWVPHYVVGTSGEQTELALVNGSQIITTVRIKAFGSSGQLASKDVSIAANGLLAVKLSDLFSLPTLLQGAPLASGHLTIDVISPSPMTTTQAPRLAGSVRFFGTNGRAVSALPVLAEGQRSITYMHVAQENASNIFTGLAMLNTSSSEATIRLEAFDRLGGLTARRDIRLPAEARVVDTINSAAFFGPAFQQVGGYLRVTSSQPLASFALFGSNTGDYLAAIEPLAK